MIYCSNILLIFITSFTFIIADDKPIAVTLDLDVCHKVGGVSQFDRKKFITVHSSHTEKDWNGEDEKMNYLLNELDVYFGRDTGAITWELNQQREDPRNPGHVEFTNMEARGASEREAYSKRKEIHNYENRSDLVVCAQVAPFWPGSGRIEPPDGSPPWALASPKATAQYMVYWLNMYTGGNGVPRPRFLEIVNEPLYELARSHPEVMPQQVFDYHREVASAIRELNKDVMLGGYTAAFPDFEKDDFQRWEKRWKAFIDTTGDQIDFYSLHLYDFPGIHYGKRQYRKGANLEATFDLLEHYSFVKSGKVKPFLISEYGSQLQDWYGQPWSPFRDWLCIKAMNSMLMQFAAKPDRILKAIPFVTMKGEWGYNYDGTGQPYYWRLMRRENEPAALTGDWVFTDQIKFYELWAGVRGERRLIESDDPNLQVIAFTDGNHLSIVLNNLTDDRKTFHLDLRTGKVEAMIAKHLYVFDNKPRLDWVELPMGQRTFDLGAEATMVLQVSLSEPSVAKRSVNEVKYFASTCFQRIKGEKPVVFEINGMAPAQIEKAILRLGIGRDHGQSLAPLVTVNGHQIDLPDGFKGPGQGDRDRFFGLMEIPVPVEWCRENNTISVEFPEAGGHVSSVALIGFSREK